MPKHYRIDLERDTPVHYLIAFLIFLVYAGSLFFPLMDKDAAHHANIALYMYEHNDWVSLVDRGKDYLDKPHLLFWTSLASFELFGVNTFAHRFPAFLFSLLSIYSTYRLARYLADKTTAKLAAVMLATSQAFVLSVTDARMETPLTAFIISGLWQLIVYIDKRRFANLVLAALFAALAFSTKGWLGPVVIFIGAFFYMLAGKRWSVLASVKTWAFIPLFLLFISPVLYAYYQQFDLHPEKIIRGRSGRSGIHFILWDQLFERSQGFDQGKSGRNSDYFFLYHTFLWAFFPWCIIGYAALFYWIRRMFYRKKWRSRFSFAVLSFAFILFAISFSKFKMPHYIIMLLPFAALFSAPYFRLVIPLPVKLRVFYPLQFVFALLVLLLTIALNYYFFPPADIVVHIAGGMLLLLFLLILIKKFHGRAVKLLCLSIGLSLVFNFFLNYNFFPQLLKYQAGNELVKKIEEQGLVIPEEDIVLVELHAHSFDFYRGHNHDVLEAHDFTSGFDSVQHKYFLLSPFLSRYIEERGFRVDPVISQPDYNITRMNLRFLNPDTRTQTADTLLLARVYRK